ncbi:hypothetical protein [Paracidovorax oryzae]|uniref:hypothetical protein n=1 Tax=Paracidovorax oryzae TaxID=862720 RepID=UPI00258700E6
MYLLDTNAYVLFFQNPRPTQLTKLEALLDVGTGIKQFLIPEVVSMEIHSVLGKYRRGGAPVQHAQCDRKIVSDAQVIACSHTCFYPARKRMSQRLFRALQKMIDDAENLNGDLQAQVAPVAQAEFAAAKRLLIRYADRHSFGSHDALVAGTALCAIQSGLQLVLVTSDKGLKAVCTAENIPTLDPLHL